MQPQLREAQPADLHDILEFDNRTHERQRKAEEWLWEFGGEHAESSVYTLMEDAGKIVGTLGVIPIPLRLRGERILSGKYESVFLLPAYRGGEIFGELDGFTESCCRARGMVCLWGYTTGVKVFQRVGFRLHDVMRDAVCIVNPGPVLADLRRQDLPLPAKVVRSLQYRIAWLYAAQARALRRRPQRELQVRDELADSGDMERLYARLRERHPDLIHIDLDGDYLRWRVFDHPLFRYRTTFVYDGDRLEAYAFANVEDKRKATLVDFTFDSADAGEFLLRRLFDELGAEGIGTLAFWGNTQNPIMRETFGLLSRYRFRIRRTPMNFAMRELSTGAGESLFDVSRWYANGLWTEGLGM